jgi:hypothetical protein
MPISNSVPSSLKPLLWLPAAFLSPFYPIFFFPLLPPPPPFPAHSNPSSYSLQPSFPLFILISSSLSSLYPLLSSLKPLLYLSASLLSSFHSIFLFPLLSLPPSHFSQTPPLPLCNSPFLFSFYISLPSPLPTPFPAHSNLSSYF